MIEINPKVYNHIITHLPLLLNRDFLLDILTNSEKTKATRQADGTVVAQPDQYIYEGKLLNVDGVLHVISAFEGLEKSTGQAVPVVSFDIPANTQLCEGRSPVTLMPGVLKNYKGTDPLETTMGRLVLNYTILVDPFGDMIPYVNELWNIGKLEKTYIFEALRTGEITVDQVKHYSRNIHHIGHFTELSVPTLSRRSLTTDPRLIAKRNELLKTYATEIAAGDPVIMNRVEQELISMDKDLLKGDSSTPFYDHSPGKSYNVARKSMYLLGGMTEKFGEDGYNFIGSSLEEGWKIKDLAVICNQVRAGSYSRAKETAKGGEETKFLIRVFQSTQVTEDDCGSDEYLQVALTPESAKDYIYRNIMVNGKLVTLTDDNIGDYISKTVNMRSPQYCHTKDGFCFTCMGEMVRTIKMDILTMAAINVSSSFTLASLKKMHGTTTRMIPITSLNRFAV